MKTRTVALSEGTNDSARAVVSHSTFVSSVPKTLPKKNTKNDNCDPSVGAGV